MAVREVEPRTVTIHGYRRAYRSAGRRGPTLLLIHGIGDSSRTWLPVLRPLARRHRVLAPDLLGHGVSDKPRADYGIGAFACGMRDLLDVLGVERATVVGHSLGGGVAAQFAYQFPERCERLVLVGSGGAGTDVHALLRLAALPGSELVLPLVTSPPARWALRTAAPVLRRAGGLGFGRDFDYITDTYDRLQQASARRAFIRTLRGVVDGHGQSVTMLDRSYLAAQIPALLLWGERDSVIPVRHVQAAQAALPGSRVAVFPGAGHFPHHDDPARFVSAVEDFVAATPAARHDPQTWRELLRTGQASATDPTRPQEGSDRAFG
jgi:pimeloyl-ACP methyl ester carboxylesterase